MASVFAKQTRKFRVVNMDLFKANFKTILLYIALSFSIISAVFFSSQSFNINKDNHLVLLADQFSRGHISLEPNDNLPLGDYSKFNGKFYLYFAPMSSLVFVPFVLLFGNAFPQVFIGITSLVLLFYLAYKVSLIFKFSRKDSLFLSLFFIFSTPLFAAGLINITAYQVQTLGALFVFLSLYEYLTKKRMILIGIFIAMAFLTRNLLLLTSIFFVIEFIRKRISKKDFVKLLIPVFLSLAFMGIYNYLRFHNFFDTGISYSITLYTHPLSFNIKHGMASIAHIPANLYSLFVMPPLPVLEHPDGFYFKFPYLRPSPWGMAIWYTSPLFLMLFTRLKKAKLHYSLLLTIFAFLVPILTFYSIGFTQYGYRYIIDFLPFLFLLLVSALKPRLGKLEISLILIGVIFNTYMIAVFWGFFPKF